MQSLNLIRQFIVGGVSYLDRLDESDIVGMVRLANDAYYNDNGSVIMSDNQYDILLEYARKRFAGNLIFRGVGAAAPAVVKNKVVLPFNMPSMDKIKPDTDALVRWTNRYKGPYVLSCKLDGVSGMYVMDKSPKLYTRGDGKVGQDISHFIGRLHTPFPSSAGVGGGDVVVRGEFVIPKSVFDAKYRGKFANARNMVSGIINSKTIDDKARDVHFVAYEVISPPMTVSYQLRLLEKLGFEVVLNRMMDKLSNEYLSRLLIEWRTNSNACLYDIDGVIVVDDYQHPRKVDGNPEHAFAFKMVISDQVAEATVVDVLWEPSKSGYLKPRVQIEPVVLGGVTIQYATGFNAAFIESNRIGVGAVIEVVRSGDVIPHIRGVVVASGCGKMPSVPYVWTKNHVDVVLENVDDDVTVRRKNITEFFKVLEVDGLSGKTVERLMESGYDTVGKILRMSKEDYLGVRGFKDVLATKIYDGVRSRVENASLVDVMVASGKFGRGIGEKKIRPILEAGTDILLREESLDAKYRKLLNIKGVGCEVARGFVDNIGRFLEFLRECGLEGKLRNVVGDSHQPPVATNNSHPFYGKRVAVTKVKDPEVKKKIKEIGAILEDKIGSKTEILVVKSLDDDSVKLRYAKERGVKIVVWEGGDFVDT